MQTEFPKSTNKFIKASMFQDQEIPLTYQGWEKRSNEDIPARSGKAGIGWKQRLKYVLRYSYPEWAVDEAGEQKLGRDEKPFKNKNWDSRFPRGYSIVYHFEEGQLESGSLPLFECFCFVRPKAGELITIGRTGSQQDTKWTIRRAGNDIVHAVTSEPRVINDEFSEPPHSEEEVPF